MREKFLASAAIACAVLASGRVLRAEDKSGVRPQVLSLPTGPGSIEGLGGSFQPQLNTGTAVYSVKIAIPPGVHGHQPSVTLAYNSGKGNGPFGVGWSVDVPYIQRRTDKGVPRYDSSDTFVYSDGEDLVPLANGTWRTKNEGSFRRFRQVSGTWEVTDKNGTIHLFGIGSGSRIERNPGEVFKWCLTSSTDTNGNVIQYNYAQFPNESKQIYVQEIRYAMSGGSFHSIAFDYQTRPDRFGDFSSGIDIRTTKRCTDIRVLSTAGLVRRYHMGYLVDQTFDPLAASQVELQTSILRSVTQYGDDNQTFLPPLRFAYTRFATTGQVIQPISPPPSRSLSSINGGAHTDTDLVDVDGDSLPDVLWTTLPFHRYYRNLGNNHFHAAGGDFTFSPPGVSLSNSNVHLADIDGDGLSDLLQSTGSGPFDLKLYRNMGNYSWASAQSLPFAGSTITFDNTLQLVDVNGDRRIDAMKTTTAGYTYYLNGENGTWTTIGRLPAVNFQMTFDNPYARLADMNGDRLQDLVFIARSGTTVSLTYWPCIGDHLWGAAVPIGSALQVNTNSPGDLLKLVDVNADGLTDVLYVANGASDNGNVFYWLNTGDNNWSIRFTATSPLFNSTNMVLRVADMNGNGSPDLVYDHEGGPAPLQYVDFTPNGKPNLLRLVDNGMGQRIAIEYRSSTQFFVQTQNNPTGRQWITRLPFPVNVVSRNTTSDSRGWSSVSDYAYWDGYYDPTEHQFRGFGYVEVTDQGDASAPTKVVRHTFDVGKITESLKGKPLIEEVVSASGLLFNRTQNVWTTQELAFGINGEAVTFAFNEQTESVVDEGTGTPAVIRTRFAYDEYGNVTQELKYGTVDPQAPPNDPIGLGLGNDEVLTYREFVHDPVPWIVDRLKSEQVKDLGGTLKSQRRSYYDNLPLGQVTRGNLTLQEDWLDLPTPRFIPTLTNLHDSFGNVTQMTDANGHSRSVEYDPVLHVYPIFETVHLDGYSLIAGATYDFGFGTVQTSTDFAGALSTYNYDMFGRLTAMLRPGGAEELYDYQLANPISHIIKRVRESIGGGTYDTYSYFDGLGRGLGKKVEGEAGQWRFVDAVSRNARGLESQKWLPYFTGSNAYSLPDPAKPSTTLQYDVPGRVARTTNPDATFSKTVYKPLVRDDWDENDNAGANTPMTYRTDGLERLVAVTERNYGDAYLTQYQWSTLGDLVRITDAHNNVKTLAYDSLRRKVGMNDVDRGIMSYVYDDVGNLAQTTDAKSQVIQYGYDFANRILTENYLDHGGGPNDPVDVAYRYDQPSVGVDFGDRTTGTSAYTSGRLASVTDLSGEEHLSYDVRGNVQWTAKRIRDPMLGILVSYTTRFAYDTMNRVTDITYPDNDRCRYTYNSASFTDRIDGGTVGQTIISNVDYAATGQIATVSYGNGVDTTRAYDDRNRLGLLTTVSPNAGQLINYSYDYDPASNIKKIADNRSASVVPLDSRRRNSQVFQYDDLYRLKQVRYAPVNDTDPDLGQIDYGYDAIGNMISQLSPSVGQPGHIADIQVNLGSMSSGGAAGTTNRQGRSQGDPPGPHAITATTNGTVYSYDDNGNMTSIEGSALTWDFKDRLVRFQNGTTDARYTYDHSGRRITKLVNKNGRVGETLYINKYFEVRPQNAPTKYVFNGDSRIAQVKGSLAPQSTRVQKLPLGTGWNLITLAVNSGETIESIFGAEAIAFTWSTVADYQILAMDYSPSAGEPLLIFTPISRIGITIGVYEQSPVSMPYPAGQSLIAWPRLEPLKAAVHLSGTINAWGFDNFSHSWDLARTSGPDFLINANTGFPSATAFWLNSTESGTIDPSAAAFFDILFYQLDHLGSVMLITDSMGEVSRETAFYPFGQPRIYEHIETVATPYLFTGKENDLETDLNYFEARFQIARAGRFVSVDPLVASPSDDRLRNPQELHPYSYCLNRPLSYTDPDGLDPNVILEGAKTANAVAGRVLDQAESLAPASSAVSIGGAAAKGLSNITDAAKVGVAYSKNGLSGAGLTAFSIGAGKAVELFGFTACMNTVGSSLAMWGGAAGFALGSLPGAFVGGASGSLVGAGACGYAAYKAGDAVEASIVPAISNTYNSLVDSGASMLQQLESNILALPTHTGN